MISTRFQKLIDALKAAECKVEKRGKNSIQVQCPVHEDKEPSMSIKEQSNGKIGIYCHAGCKTKDILSELGFDGFGILFPDDNSKSDRRIVATYPYKNEDGELLFEAVRFHPKDFRQRQPATGGGWKWNLKGVRRVIYNLPEVLEACNEDRPIFLCEGEKDADALINRDIVATTCPMGAGKWRDGYNEFFQDGEVVILPDNDKSGKEHAMEVAAGLVDHADKVRILQLPGLKIKEDVSDWFMKGGTADELLELAFDMNPVGSKGEAEIYLDLDTEYDKDDQRNVKNLFFEEDLKLYANDKDERLIADFVIEIESIVKDAWEGQIFYIKIKRKKRGRPQVTETIEIKPENLDDVRSFYKAIRPHSLGEIIYYRREKKVKPLTIFKYLLQNFDKPIVLRPDHVGFTKENGRPFWIFGNALICPPWKDHDSKIVKPNKAGEFIVNDKLGFTLPLYENEDEKEQIAPFINTDVKNMDIFLGEVKTKIINLIGGGDPDGRAQNYGKLLLGYVIYHLYEQQLYYANDINGHTVMMYVFGPKGTGKTTYFNTLLRAFFGLHKTKELKGSGVSVAGLENSMGMYSQLPVCYDEYNPEDSKVPYQNINGYYHRTSRSVSDMDRKNRNKYTPVRSTLAITSNYRINLDIDQADATESRMIYFQYKKEYRSDDEELFEWFQNNLNELSSITAYLLLNQTDEKRNTVKEKATKLYKQMKGALEEKVNENPKKYSVEHRLTDNYTRLLAAYELIFGRDNDFREFVFEEILKRFVCARSNNPEHALLQTLAYLSSSGRIKQCWHYQYNVDKEELYVDINQCYQTYSVFKREEAISNSQFRETLKDYFNDYGGHETGSMRWYGSYIDFEKNKQQVNKTQHSYILTFDQVRSNNMFQDIFPPNQEQTSKLKADSEKQTENKIDFKKLDEPPF